MVREDTAIILNDDSVVSSFGFEKNLSTITAWVLILLLSYDKSTIILFLCLPHGVACSAMYPGMVFNTPSFTIQYPWV